MARAVCRGLDRLFSSPMIWVVSICLVGAAGSPGVISSPPCKDQGGRPHIVLKTDEGTIAIELFPDAAPSAVRRLIRLVEGPTFHPEITQNNRERGPVGYYDGLVFDEATPGGFITTSLRPPPRAILIETEIDADAVGLDQEKITTGDEAMFVWQHELLPYQTRLPDDRLVPPRLQEWLQEWASTFDPAFLIGVSRKEINEALGYSYRSGLDSRPVTRGSVSLEPATPQWASPRLTIALRRIAHQDGRRMVIGHVVEGLEVADSIATRRLSPHKAVQHRPLVPAKIFDAGIEYRDVQTEEPEGEGAE